MSSPITSPLIQAPTPTQNQTLTGTPQQSATGIPPQSPNDVLKRVFADHYFGNLDDNTQREMFAKQPAFKGVGDLNDKEYAIWKSKVHNDLGIVSGKNSPSKADHIIEALRPFISEGAGDAVGLGASALGSPALGLPARMLTKMGVDAVMQHMEGKPPSSMTSDALGLEPGGTGSTIANSLQQMGVNAAGGKIISGAIKGIGALPAAISTPGGGNIIKEGVKNVVDEFGKGSWRQYTTGHMLAVPVGLITHSVIPHELVGAGITGVKIGKAAIKTLQNNPKTAPIITAIMNGAPMGIAHDVASKAITDALQGASMTLSLENGEDKEVILKDGKMVPKT